MPVDRAKVEEACYEIIDAYNKRDWDRMMGHFALDTAMIVPNREDPKGYRETKGVENLRQRYTQSQRPPRPGIRSSNFRIEGIVWCTDEAGIIWKQVDNLESGGTQEHYGLSVVLADSENKVKLWRDYF